jgi:hypothetical protein
MNEPDDDDRDEPEPEAVLRAKRAYEAALAGDQAAMTAIAREMASPPAATPWPGPPMPARPAASGKQASSGVWIAIAAGALSVLAGGGLAAYKHFARVPITDTPCGKGAIKLIGSLTQPLTVTFYVTKGSPAVDRLIEQVNAMMRDLAASSNGKLVYEPVLVTTDEQRSQAKEAGLQETAFGSAGKDGESAVISRGFCGFALKYGSERESIPMLSPDQTQGLPFWIVQKIREIRGRADNVSQRFGVVSGKGEIKLTEPSLVAAQQGRGGGPTMKGIMEQAMPYYRFDDLDLRGGAQEIDASLAGVLVTQPGVDYTDEELRRIDQFLMRGGKSVVVFASAVNIPPADARMKAELSLHGLDRLLAGYGVEMKKDVLLDWGGAVTIPVSASGGAPVKVMAPGILLVEHDDKATDGDQRLDNTFVPFFRLDEVAFPFASSLLAHPEKQPGARFVTVARSTAKTTSETGSPLSLSPIVDAAPRGDQQQRIVALAVSGKLRSAFAAAAGGVDAAPESSRLLVISSAQFLVNPMARAGNPLPSATDVMLGAAAGDEDLQMLSQPYAQRYLTATILAFKNTLDWASADDATVSCSALLLGSKEEQK